MTAPIALFAPFVQYGSDDIVCASLLGKSDALVEDVVVDVDGQGRFDGMKWGIAGTIWRICRRGNHGLSRMFSDDFVDISHCCRGSLVALGGSLGE